MTNIFRLLMSAVVDGDLKKAQAYAKSIAMNNKVAKDKAFCDSLLIKLETKKQMIELPRNLSEILVFEDVTHYPEERFLLRSGDAEVARRLLDLSNAQEQLSDLGIRLFPSLLLYGASGCGKTEFARWIAHKLDYPFVYVRFSALVSSHLGETQKNLSRIFDFMRTQKMLLCFDEIDAIGTMRGGTQEIGEMSRITISLMQELDRVNNGSIIIGTTNRADAMDPALVRRFHLQHEVLPLSVAEANQLARAYMDYAGILSDEREFDEWFDSLGYRDSVRTSRIVGDCTELIVNSVLRSAKNGEVEQ